MTNLEIFYLALSFAVIVYSIVAKDRLAAIFALTAVVGLEVAIVKEAEEGFRNLAVVWTMFGYLAVKLLGWDEKYPALA